MGEVKLRPVRAGDLDLFFAHYRDPVASRMAAFIGSDPDDRKAFDEKWARIRANPDITVRTILLDGAAVGHVASFVMGGDLQVTYWIDRRCWGQGVATAALRQLLALVPRRPIHGRAAKDNLASLRVLEKCGFEKVGEDRGFARARGEEVDELVFRKEGP